jgi:hypothetical protein
MKHYGWADVVFIIHPYQVAARLALNFGRCGAEYVVRHQRPPDPLQRELTHRLDLYDFFYLREHPRTDEDLPGLGFIA